MADDKQFENYLKFYAAKAIGKSSLSNTDKISLLKELKQCDVYRTMAFLNKGQMFYGELNEQKIEKEFKSNKQLQESIQNLQEDLLGLGLAVGATAYVALLGASLYSAYKNFRANTDAAYKKCNTFAQGNKKKVCYFNVRILDYRKRIEVLKKADCSKANNPASCRSNAHSVMSSYQDKINKFSNKLRELNLPEAK